MLRKDVGLTIEQVNDSGEIKGYGSTFDGEPDSYGDVVLKGAFEESLAAHKSAGTMPLMLWGHQAWEVPIGDWRDMKEDDKGLFVEGQIDLDDDMGKRVHRALKRGSVSGLSIGYDTIESREDPKRPRVRLLEKLDLWEVSPVNFPANRNALIMDVKGKEVLARWKAGDRPKRRELEEMLKGAFGVSNSEAERMTGALLELDRGGPGDDVDLKTKLFAEMRG